MYDTKIEISKRVSYKDNLLIKLFVSKSKTFFSYAETTKEMDLSHVTRISVYECVKVLTEDCAGAHRRNLG